MINIGDDVTISGKVVDVMNNIFIIETSNGTTFCVGKSDIKTHRPNTKEGKNYEQI